MTDGLSTTITLAIGDTVTLNVDVLQRENWTPGQHLTLKVIAIVQQENGSLSLVLGHEGDV